MADRRGRDGRRGLLVLLVVVVLLAALAVAADRIALRVTENQAARQLQTRLGTATRPKVQIEHFPFLPQLLRNSYSSVRIVADDVRAPDQPDTPLAHVDLRLADVRTSDRFQRLSAARASGTVTVDYPTAKTLTGQSLGYAPPGRLSVAVRTQLLGLPVTGTVVGRPVVDEAKQTLTLGDPTLSVSGVDVPDSTAQALLGSLVKPTPISGVPYGLKVRGVTAQPDGLVVDVTGRDLVFR